MRVRLGKVLLAVCSAMVIMVVLGVNDLAGQDFKWEGSGGWGPDSNYSKLYDPQTVENLSGEVIKVEKIIPMKDMYLGVHLVLKTGAETISVHLGPGWFIKYQDLRLEKNNKIEIKGSRVNLEGKPVIIASEVKKGEEMLKLRDGQGFPLWSAWRR